MDLRGLLYGAYERRLAAALPPDRVPEHVGVILDGNRRWARAAGIGLASGHRRGADKIDEFLGWCAELHIDVVTLWLLSTDNLARPADELAPCCESSRTPFANSPRHGAGGSIPLARSTCCQTRRPGR